MKVKRLVGNCDVCGAKKVECIRFLPGCWCKIIFLCCGLRVCQTCMSKAFKMLVKGE